MPIIGATQLEPVNILGSYVQGLEGARANRMARAQEAAMLREMEEKTALRNMLMGATEKDLQDPSFLNRLAITPGGAATAQSLAQSMASQRAAKKTDLEINAENRKQAREMVGATLSLLRGALKDPSSYPMRLQMAADMGYDVSTFPQTFDPSTTPALIQAQIEAITPVERQLELEDKAAQSQRDKDRLGLEKERVGLERERVAISRSAEARQAAEATDKNIVARTETDAAGNVTFYNKFGDKIKTETGAGKPSATYEKTKATREQTQRDLSGALSTLKEIVKPGGLIEQSTGSIAGKGVDILARTGGFALEGDIALGKLQVLSDQILKLVPRFEGPQSDKDTQSYREAAGQLADGTLPRKVRKAAAETLIDLYTKRQNQFTLQGAELETSPSIQSLLDKYK